jgi:predicted DNA-binding transcriptional regulator YafY
MLQSKRTPRRIVADLHSRPPLARMMYMHSRLQARRYPNCRKLAEELEVSSKTVQRDLEFMRYRLCLPIEYDQLHFGFYYSEPVANFPTIEISEGELVALYVGQKALAQYKGTSFEKPLAAALRKISDGLSDKISFSWSDLDAAVSFRGIGATAVETELFETLGQAVLHSLEVEFDYKKLGAKTTERRRVRPYHLGLVDNAWYLFGFDCGRQQLRTFAVPRIRSVRLTKANFRRPSGFSLAHQLAFSFGVYSRNGNTKCSTIRIRFDPFAAQLIQEREWHPTQKIKRLRNGSVELVLKLASFEEIERWILSWGAHAQVLAPVELKRRIAATLKALARAYS